MDRNGFILNPRLAAAIVGLGHGEHIVIADAGLPIPLEAALLDLSLTRGIPGFCQTLEVITRALAIESALVARELATANPALEQEVARILAPVPLDRIEHAALKDMVVSARLVVRTGETTPYANIVLVGGVTF